MMKVQYMLAAIAMVAALSAPALAADAPAAAPLTFGVVDMNKVLQATDAAKGIFSELEGKRKEFQTQISKEEDALRSTEGDIMKQKATLSQEAFDKKRKDFEQKMLDGQKMVQEKKRLLDQAFNGAILKLRGEAAKVVAEIAKEKGYSAVLTQDAVMLSLPQMDMTDEVITRLNKSVKKIPIDWSAVKDAGKDKKAG